MKLVTKFNTGWTTRFNIYCLYYPTRYKSLEELTTTDSKFYVLDYTYQTNLICKVRLHDWGPKEERANLERYASKWFFKIEEEYRTDFQRLYLYNEFRKLKGFNKKQLDNLIYVIKI